MRGQILVGTLLPILTAVFNLKSQMLGGSPSGLVQEEILDLIIKMNPSDEPSFRLPSLSKKPVDNEDDLGGYSSMEPEDEVFLL
jgi:hypothetical protein